MTYIHTHTYQQDHEVSLCEGEVGVCVGGWVWVCACSVNDICCCAIHDICCCAR
jgi:hypothetical protein